jgi:hypothetical protein
MKIDRKELMKVIKEEYEGLMSEINPGHTSKGTFAAKGKGKIYSLTKNAADDVGEDSELEVPARGSITKDGKLASKFGMNTGSPDKQCGRLEITGKDKKKTRSCKDYPKSYWNEAAPKKISPKERTEKIFPGSSELTTLSKGIAETLDPADDAYIRAVTKQEMDKMMGQLVKKKQKGGCRWQDIMRAIQDVETAQKGNETK